MAKNSTINNKVFKIFTPGQNFPSISISGSDCELNCAHCGKQYLQHMLTANSPERLVELCSDLDARNATGALISGGCDITGQVRLEPYFNAFELIKLKTGLKLNVHTGLLGRDQAWRLGKTGIDVASVDVVGNQNTIRTVYGLHHPIKAYKYALTALKEGGVRKIVPHICIGLDFGNIKGEYNAIDMISDLKLELGQVQSALVFIILIPTKGSAMAECSPPKIEDAIDVIKYARAKCAGIPIFLGCMRPRSKKYREYSQSLEISAIEAGIDGIVLPSKNTVQYIQKQIQGQNVKIERYNNCCAVI